MILAIDTATPAVSVALADTTGIVASFTLLRGRRHVETVLPVVEQLLDHAQCSYADITVVAVDRGPGLFTGLRVGVATAKALALALGVPVVTATSLQILAHGFAQHHRDVNVLTVIDARRREVYAQLFRIDARGVTGHVAEPACVAPATADGLLDGVPGAFVVGDVAVGSEAFARRPVVAGHPSAERLALMVPSLERSGPDELEVLYLRAPDAEINWTSRP